MAGPPKISLDNTVEFHQGIHSETLDVCRTQLLEHLDTKKSNILIDLGSCDNIDGRGIALLLQCNHALREINKRLEVMTHSHEVKNMLDLLSFGSKFRVNVHNPQ